MTHADHVSDEIKDLCERGWSISKEEYCALRMNCYERVFIVPFLSKEALEHVTRKCLKHCGPVYNLPVTYDEIIIHVLVPELLKRLDMEGECQ